MLGAAIALAFVALSPPAFAQKRDQIYGQTCSQLFRSCFRICVRHKNEPRWKSCEADCTSARQTCRITGIWKSRTAKIRPARR
jgi:hypothetical protein